MLKDIKNTAASIILLSKCCVEVGQMSVKVERKPRLDQEHFVFSNVSTARSSSESDRQSSQVGD